jgi:hypothetical protein
MKRHYYFFTDKTFTSDDFTSPEDAIKAGEKITGLVRIVRASDSETIWPTAKEGAAA